MLGIDKARNRNAAELLLIEMEDISEDCWCAGWMDGLEFSLWKILESGERHYGHSTVNETQIERLRYLSSEAGGWWYWNGAAEPLARETFIPLGAWKEMYLSKT